MQKLELNNQEITDLYTKNKKEKELIQAEIVQMGYIQLVRAFHDIGANLSVTSQRQTKKQLLFEIAYGNKDQDIVEFFMDLTHEQFLDGKALKNSKVLLSMKQKEVLFDQISRRLLCPKILLEVPCLVPLEMQQSALYKYAKFIKSKDINKRKLWDVLYGAYMPNLLCNPGDEILR